MRPAGTRQAIKMPTPNSTCIEPAQVPTKYHNHKPIHVHPNKQPQMLTKNRRFEYIIKAPSMFQRNSFSMPSAYSGRTDFSLTTSAGGIRDNHSASPNNQPNNKAGDKALWTSDYRTYATNDRSSGADNYCLARKPLPIAICVDVIACSVLNVRIRTQVLGSPRISVAWQKAQLSAFAVWFVEIGLANAVRMSLCRKSKQGNKDQANGRRTCHKA